jgi:hypothetical protein
MENMEENCEKIGKIWKKSKLKCEKIWKIWRKCKLNSEKIWKISHINVNIYDKTARVYSTS